MELNLNARGMRLTDRIREAADHKLARLERHEPKLERLDIEVIAEHNPRRGGEHRVEVVATRPRRTYRAHAEAPEVEAALDLVVERLERQIRDDHQKKRTRLLSGARIVRSDKVRGATKAAADE